MTSAAVSGESSATFSYNAVGERVERRGSGVPDGGTLYESYDALGNLSLITTGAAGVEQFFPPVAGRNYAKYENGVTYFMHANVLGSTTMVTDQAGGIVQDQEFYPWGQAGPPAGGAGWYQFAGFDSHPVDGREISKSLRRGSMILASAGGSRPIRWAGTSPILSRSTAMPM